MAIDTKFYTSKELQIGVAIDSSTVGTAASSFTAIEAESITLPTLNDYMEERRGGAASGTFVSEADLFKYENGSVHEVSASGFMTDELQAILMPNAFGQGFAGNPDAIALTVANNQVNKTFTHNETAAADKTLSFAINGVGDTGGDPAEFNDCIILSGCVITSLTLNWDANEDGGRIKFDLTAQTRTKTSAYDTAASIGVYSTNYCYGTKYNSTWKLMDADVFYKTWSLAIENPVSFLGSSGSAATSLVDGEPQTYIRSVPEMNITFSSVVKYDTNLDSLWTTARGTGTNATNASTNGVLITDNSNNFIINIEKCSIEEIAFDEGDFLGLSTTLKARSSSGTNIINYVFNQ